LPAINHGASLPVSLMWLVVARSVKRTRPLPSAFTSIDHFCAYALPVFFEVIRPFLGAHPASSPEILEYFELFSWLISLFPIFTVPVPDVRSLSVPKSG
jgi:hypothetical protein